MAETVKKPSSSRSAKERRNVLFRCLDGVLSLAHKKIHNGGNSDRQKQGWARVLVSAVSTYGGLLKDEELEPVGTMKSTYWKTRKSLAYKLQNPRLLKISFHTFRHWKATMLYHEKPDTLYVRDFLGHKELRNTERYITIARTIFGPGTNDKFIIKIAANAEEAIGLGENGFEPFDVVDGVRLYRKRK